MRIRTTRPALIMAAATATLALVAGAAPALADDARGRSDAPAASQQQARKLRILLTNDDGYSFAFIRALQGKLKAAGHDAVIVAPATDQSGKGSGINAHPGAIVKAAEVEPGIWSVEGTPADSVQFGLKNVFAGNAPDLVLSGPNAGQNIGPMANHSGTVGATVTALEHGVPAVAVSVEYDIENVATNPFPTLPQTLDFTVRLVDRLAATAGKDRLLPKNAALNVNYPARPKNGKVEFTNVGRANSIVTSYVAAPEECATCFRLVLDVDPAASESMPNSDTQALLDGAVSISLLDGNWTNPSWDPKAPSGNLDAVKTRLRLAGLTA